MTRPCPIALTGLTPTEQVLLEGALFQSASSQLPGAVLEKDLSRALLIIANADDALAVRVLRARLPAARVLLVGASDQGTGWPVVSRPLRLHAVLEAVRRSLAPVLERREHPPEPTIDTRTRSGGWLRRLTGDGPGFLATQPFMAKGGNDHDDFEQTHQYELTAAQRSHETTQPVSAFRVDATQPMSVGRFEATQAFVVPPGDKTPATYDAEADFASTEQIEREIPSVLPSNWESEVAEWETELATRAGRVGANPAPSISASSDIHPTTRSNDLLRGFAPTDAQPLEPAQAAKAGVARPVEAAAGPDSAGRVLVVGAPGPATGGLLKTLRSAGFTADFADNAALTLQSVSAQAYRVVFLIEVTLGESAITLCRAIRARPGVPRPAPRIVIVAAHRSLLSRIRASFAGSNAWMTIPLDRAALVKYIRQTAAQPTR